MNVQLLLLLSDFISIPELILAVEQSSLSFDKAQSELTRILAIAPRLSIKKPKFKIEMPSDNSRGALIPKLIYLSLFQVVSIK